jgi:uncharacterized phage protein (TIGR02218 family)
MKSAGAYLIAREGAPLRTPVEIYHFTRGTSEWFFTSADAAVWFNGDEYVPAALTRGRVSWNANLDSGEIEIEMPKSSPVIADTLAGAAIAPAWVRVWKILRDDPGLPTLLFYGAVLNAAVSGPTARVRCVGMDYLLRREVPRLNYTPECNWQVFGTECGKLSASYAITPAVTVSADGLTLTAAAFGAEADGYWTYGSVEQGDYKRMIVGHTGNDVTLEAAIPGLTTGETVTALPGCDGTIATCLAKFNNVVNFGGFPYIPLDNPVTWVHK